MVEIKFPAMGKAQIRVLWHVLSHRIKHWTTGDLYEAMPDLAPSSIRCALMRLHRLGVLRRIVPQRRSPYSPVRFVLNAAYRLPPEISDSSALEGATIERQTVRIFTSTMLRDFITPQT